MKASCDFAESREISLLFKTKTTAQQYHSTFLTAKHQNIPTATKKTVISIITCTTTAGFSCHHIKQTRNVIRFSIVKSKPRRNAELSSWHFSFLDENSRQTFTNDTSSKMFSNWYDNCLVIKCTNLRIDWRVCFVEMSLVLTSNLKAIL